MLFRSEKEIYRAIISAAVLCQWIAEHDTPPTDGEAELLDQEEEFERLYSTLRNMLPLVKAVNSRALLLVTLYGCTNSNLYYRMAHELVDPWRDDPSPKRSKALLIQRLHDYDIWLKH